MKYKVSYTASAKRDIRGIYEYISNDLFEPGTYITRAEIVLASFLCWRRVWLAVTIKITLSTKLGELRMTQAELSRKTGIRPSTISEWYRSLFRVRTEQCGIVCLYSEIRT